MFFGFPKKPCVAWGLGAGGVAWDEGGKGCSSVESVGVDSVRRVLWLRRLVRRGLRRRAGSPESGGASPETVGAAFDGKEGVSPPESVTL